MKTRGVEKQLENYEEGPMVALTVDCQRSELTID